MCYIKVLICNLFLFVLVFLYNEYLNGINEVFLWKKYDVDFVFLDVLYYIEDVNICKKDLKIIIMMMLMIYIMIMKRIKNWISRGGLINVVVCVMNVIKRVEKKIVKKVLI